MLEKLGPPRLDFSEIVKCFYSCMTNAKNDIWKKSCITKWWLLYSDSTHEIAKPDRDFIVLENWACYLFFLTQYSYCLNRRFQSFVSSLMLHKEQKAFITHWISTLKFLLTSQTCHFSLGSDGFEWSGRYSCWSIMDSICLWLEDRVRAKYQF